MFQWDYVSANTLPASNAMNVDIPNARNVDNVVRLFDIDNSINIIIKNIANVVIPMIWYAFISMYHHLDM